jgi:hypothetical protein
VVSLLLAGGANIEASDNVRRREMRMAEFHIFL